jgi:hypothetical protein
MAKLTSYVHVHDDRGTSTAFGPDDEVPEWAARKMGAHVFEDGQHPFPDTDGDGETDRPSGQEPPRSGKGSGRDAWVAFAAEKGHQVNGDTSRDQIIEDLANAGLIEK